MYLPEHFNEQRVEVMHELMHSCPFATIVAATPPGLVANSVPLELAPSEGPLGALRGHIARANRTWDSLSAQVDALVLFHGPQAYVSPSWYESKKLEGAVVPTWNYITVHAYGALRLVDEPQWLRALVTRLTARYESTQGHPWKVTDAPANYIDGMLRAIVGIEIPIRRLEGKWKLSQNRSIADRLGVARGLQASGDPLARELAACVLERAR